MYQQTQPQASPNKRVLMYQQNLKQHQERHCKHVDVSTKSISSLIQIENVDVSTKI